MVFLSSRISPRTSTVIFFERSPVATAVVTSAMLRTWAVRLAAMKFTLSVRSFHVPAAPRTSAWPPSLPAWPTPRAHLADHARRPGGEGAELRDRPVKGVGAGDHLALQHPSGELERHRLRQIDLGDHADGPRLLARGVAQVAYQRLHGL